MKLSKTHQKKNTLIQRVNLVLILLIATAVLSLKAQNNQTWIDFERANPNSIADWILLIESNQEFKVSEEMKRGQLEIQHKTWLTEFRSQNNQTSEPKWWDVSKAVKGMNLTADGALSEFTQRGYDSKNFKIVDEKLMFNGNVEAKDIPTEILNQKNKASAELNLQAAIKFFQNGEKLNAESFEKFSEAIHKAWILSESWILDKFYQEKSGSSNSAISDLKTADGISDWVEKNLTLEDILNLKNNERSYDAEKIQQMVSYNKLSDPVKQLDRIQAKVTLLNFITGLKNIVLSTEAPVTKNELTQKLKEMSKERAIFEAKKR